MNNPGTAVALTETAVSLCAVFAVLVWRRTVLSRRKNIPAAPIGRATDQFEDDDEDVAYAGGGRTAPRKPSRSGSGRR